MARLLLPFLAPLLLAACSNPPPPPAAPTSSPPAASSAPSPAITTRPPAEVILADADAALPPASGRDHVGITQAASEQQNQPLALTEYRHWGWVEESSRTWSAGVLHLDESLLLLTRPEGASLAFQSWAGGLPQRAACRAGLGLEECAEDPGELVGRVGRYTFRLSGPGVDLERLATIQAERIRA
ncbi:MAG TPA: hypothetical protein VLQ79_00310 [Myxococcaceae bacterium]|nr:hypothetical protein [Myxococcaceae bacterium]